MNHRPARILSLLALLALPLLPAAAWAVADCDADSPARPVPQFDPSAPNVSLWPIDSQTGDIKLKPAGVADGTIRVNISQLPPNRDSTQYITLSVPGEISGHELFQDVTVPGSRNENAPVSDYVFTVYNAGVQAWDVSTTPENPKHIDTKDGWPAPAGYGEWSHFPFFGEEDTYIYATDSIQDGSIVYIGVSGLTGVGFSLWTFNTNTKAFAQIYQDLNVWSRDVSMAKDPTNGRIYAFVADLGGAPGNDGGIRTYDATQAASSGLCVDLQGNNVCGIFEGEVGTIPRAQFVSALVANGEIYVAASDGNQGNGSLALEIWEVNNPASPGATPSGASVRRFQGLGTKVSSPELFTYDGVHYIAFVENLGTGSNPEQMRIHDVSACLDSNGCTSLGTAKAKETIKNSFARFNFLDVSFANGTPYLHYGMEASGLFGSGFERLWELGGLPQTYAANTLPELTDGGGTYADPCDGAIVDYFGDYYERNDHGLRNFSPRHAVFNGPYLYRAGVGVFDVHQIGGTVQTNDPSITPRLQGEGSIDATTFWLDEDVTLAAQVSNCLESGTGWCWQAVPTNFDVDVFPVPSNINGCDATFDDLHTLSFLCQGTGRCADSSVTVAAWNTSASCGGTAFDPQEVTFQLRDPEVDAVALNSGGTTFPECQVVSLSGDAAGRGAVEWQWLVDGEPIVGCGGTVPAGGDLGGETFACQWDSSGLTFGPLIFEDGFESGNCLNWDLGCSVPTAPSGFVYTAEQPAAALGGLSTKAGGTVTVELELRQVGGAVLDTVFESITFNPVGTPAFDGPLATPIVNGSGATLKAAATDTTTWTWEVENPNVPGSPCSFNANKNCETTETSVDTIDYLWDGAGTYQYKVSLSNCSSGGSVSATGSATVQDAVQPQITSFVVSTNSIQTANNPNRPCKKDLFGSCGAGDGAIWCQPSKPIEFLVTTAAAGSFNFSFDWERASTGDTPNFSNATPTSVNNTTHVFSHTFGSNPPSPNFPISKVQFGNEMALGDTLVFGICN